MSSESTPYEIFISYSRKDNQPILTDEAGWVTALRDFILADHRRFSTEPLRIFLDTEEIRDMDDWQHRILAALQHSKILLVCLSPNYFASEYCRWEWEEYITHQVHKLMGSDSIASIHFIEVPGSVAAQNQKWYESVRRVNYTDIRRWFPDGVKALQEQEVQRRMAVLGQSLWERLERARRAESAPGNLRRQNPYFVGRREELLKLHENLIRGALGVVTTLHGLGGQGKTELTVTYAHAWADCYPVGLWVLAAEGKKELLPLIGELAYAPELNYTPSDMAKADPVLLGREVLAELQRRAHSMRAKAPNKSNAALLILDNVSDPALLSGVQLSTLPQVNWLRMVATTRIGPENLPSQKHSLAMVAVDSLGEADAVTLVRDHQPNQRFASPEEETAVREIVAELGGFTLAVEQVAVYLGLYPEIAPSTYLKGLRQKGLTLTDVHGQRKEVAGEISHREKQLGLILKATLGMLDSVGHTALGFAVLLPPDWVAWPWLQALTTARHPELARDDPAEPDPWTSLRRQLKGLRLLTPGDQAETSRLHRLIAAHLREGAAKQGQMAANQQALVDYLVMRAKMLSLSPAHPSPWEMEALILSLPGFLQPGNSHHDLANWTVFFSDKLVTYRTLAAARLLLDAAHTLLMADAADDPANSEWQQDLAVSYSKVGDVLKVQGDLGQALTFYQKSLAIREKLAAADPANSEWQHDLGAIHDRVGDVLKVQGDLGQALTFYQKSLAIAQKLAADDPANSEWQQDLAVSYNKVGDVLKVQGDLRQALTFYQKSLAIAQKLAADDPVNSAWQRDLGALHDMVGDVLKVQGDLGEALAAYQKSLAIRERLAAADPSNSVWQHDLGAIHDRVGDVLKVQGDLRQALTFYQKSLAIREKLVAADPANSEWQRDLGAIHDRVGDVLIAQGDLGQALTFYQKSLAIRERLVAADPANSEWQRDLGAIHDRVGDVLKAQGDLGQALAVYQKSLAIAQKLAADDPANSVWQRDLALSYNKVGDVFIAQGDLGQALAVYQKSLAIAQKLAAADLVNSAWQRDLGALHARVGDVLIAQGDLGQAMTFYQKSLAIAQKLAADDPTNSVWQRDLSVSHDRVGDVLKAQGDLGQALAAYQKSLAIAQKLAADDPANSDWQRDLAVSHYIIATISELTGSAQACLAHWYQCLVVMQGMRQKGMFLDPPLVQLLQQLEQRFK